ncbi:phosphatidic acid phosphatase type 2/haloperoxidase [Trametes elegans]|nr:phosphatidic acid phosphatase type 2/haloperoxidase [Trametes elegans]
MPSNWWQELNRSIIARFGTAGFSFVDPAYCVDWICSGLMILASVAIKSLPPYEREFSIKDSLIDHKHHHNQQVCTISGDLNWILAFLAPLVITVIVGFVRRSAIDVHHSALTLWSARCLSTLITEFLKNRVGKYPLDESRRLRPDFLARCKWDKETKACTGSLDSILEGRRSFPSGHSSTAFTGMMFLSLWIAGATGAWRLTEPVPGRSIGRSKLARLLLSLAPLAFATWVAVSRLEDYRHHKEDVIVGSLIGMACATITYLIYWPNPLKPEQHAPRVVYDETLTDSGEHVPRERYDYELAGMGNEHAEQNV